MNPINTGSEKEVGPSLWTVHMCLIYARFRASRITFVDVVRECGRKEGLKELARELSERNLDLGELNVPGRKIENSAT